MNIKQNVQPTSKQVISDEDLIQSEIDLQAEMAATQAALAQDDLVKQMIELDNQDD